MTDVPEGLIVHMTPARLRVKIPGKRRDASFFDAVREELVERPTVERVEVNPATASILVHTSDASAFLRTLRCEGPFTIVEQAPAEQFDPFIEVRRTFAGWDEQIQQWTGGRYNATRTSAFLALGAIVAFQLARGKRLSVAVTLLLYGGRAVQRWWLSASEADSDRITDEESPRLLADQTAG